jgi:exodeoxyribonuclease-3
MLTLATYNVNSIRARLDRVMAWLGRAGCDVVCLQELKVADEDFPRDVFEGAGWHCAFHGQRTYNGVAILSRTPITDITYGLSDGVHDAETRLLTARVQEVRIVSAYIPNGQTVGSAKWAYKLAWLGRLRDWLDRTVSPDDHLVLAGDFNVAPEDRDVARPDEWRDTVLCHSDARAAFRRLVEWGLVDAIRLHHHGDGPYSWWDYRMLGFPKNNGLRIDHILLSRDLGSRCREAYVVRDERKGKQPSDHAPVVAVLALD